MSKLHRLTREPALVIGVLTTGFSLAILFGLDVSVEQVAGVGVFIGALMALVRFLTTPSSEVLAQVKPSGATVAGPASYADTGAPLTGNTSLHPLVPVVEVPVDPDAP